MERMRSSWGWIAALCVLTVVGGTGCYSRSARKKAMEEAVSPAKPAPAVVVVRRAPAHLASSRTVRAPVVRAKEPAAVRARESAVVARAPEAEAAPAARKPSTSLHYGRPGFAAYESDSGRLWIFRDGSDDLREFLKQGEPAKRVTRIGAGPDGKSLMSSDARTIDAYLAATVYAHPGFFVDLVDGRLWVFREGSKDLAAFRTSGEPSKRVTRIAAGPDDLTLVGPDADTLDAYMAAVVYARPGYATFLADGRLWVFRDPSSELDGYRKNGEPAKRVTRIGAGPHDRTLVGPDGETLDAYLNAIGR